MTARDAISAAFRGEPAPTTITPRRSPVAEVFTYYRGSMADTLEAAAQRHMTELQVKEGRSPADAISETNDEILKAYQVAVNAGRDDMQAVEFATRCLDKRTTAYRSNPRMRVDRRVAEAASRNYTPQLVHDIREGA